MYAAAAGWPRYLERIFALSFTATARWPGDGSRVKSPRRAQLKSARKTGLRSHECLGPVTSRVRLGSTGSDRLDSISAAKRVQENFAMCFPSYILSYITSCYNYTTFHSSKQLFTASLIACNAEGRL
jgi:hypothetical protein